MIVLVLALAGCQVGSGSHAVPSVPQMGGDLKCPNSDHPYEDPQAGWSQNPPGLDLTFDITYAPAIRTACSPAAPSTASPRVAASPCPGDFAFMILSTYERGSSADLASWVGANFKPGTNLERISWGNSVEASRLPDGRRIALTPHHVVIMDLHSGLLDLESEMSTRLGTWKFSF